MIEKRAFLVIGLSALASPLGFLAANLGRAPKIDRVFVVAVGLIVLGLALHLALSWRRATARSGSAAAVFVVIVSFIGLAPGVFDAMSGLMLFLVSLLLGVAGALVVVLATERYRGTDRVILWVIGAMVAAPLLTMVLSGSSASASEEPERDIVIVFLDGYAGARSLEELFGFDNGAFYDGLRAEGFDVVEDARASYTMTYASIASTLDMEYLAEGRAVDSRLRSELYGILGGDNQFVDKARSRGYRFTYVDSGWSGTRCGSDVDICVPGLYLDETLWYLLQRTFIAGLMDESFGQATTLGGLNSLDQVAGLDLDNGVDDFVFVHVLLPHPPLFLDEACEMSYSPDLAGLNIWGSYLAHTSRARRMDAYVQQVRCVNSRVAAISSKLGADSERVLMFLGDHGTDSLGQLTKPVTDWNQADIAERFDTFIAIRGCDGDPPSETINVLRFVGACADLFEYQPLEYRRFLVPVEELFPDDLIREVDGE